tara:strand:+ start:773 stop:2122 length:1350 start_codon:yes stop_codon:yes gene_type:complete
VTSPDAPESGDRSTRSYGYPDPRTTAQTDQQALKDTGPDNILAFLKSNRKITILVVCLIILVPVLSVMCAGSQDESQEVDSRTSEQALKVSMYQLLGDYERDKDFASEKYEGKLIETTGRLSRSNAFGMYPETDDQEARRDLLGVNDDVANEDILTVAQGHDAEWHDSLRTEGRLRCPPGEHSTRYLQEYKHDWGFDFEYRSKNQYRVWRNREYYIRGIPVGKSSMPKDGKQVPLIEMRDCEIFYPTPVPTPTPGLSEILPETLLYSEQTTNKPDLYGVVNPYYPIPPYGFVPIIYDKATASESQAMAYANWRLNQSGKSFFPHRYMTIENGTFTIYGLIGLDDPHSNIGNVPTGIAESFRQNIRDGSCEISTEVFDGLPVTRVFLAYTGKTLEIVSEDFTVDQIANYVTGSSDQNVIVSETCSAFPPDHVSYVPAYKDYVPGTKPTVK